MVRTARSRDGGPHREKGQRTEPGGGGRPAPWGRGRPAPTVSPNSLRQARGRGTGRHPSYFEGPQRPTATGQLRSLRQTVRCTQWLLSLYRDFK